MPNEKLSPPAAMGHGWQDKVTAAARASSGAIPVIGSALAEAVAPLIKGQRQERAEDYIRYLELRLNELEVQVVNPHPSIVEIIEQGLHEAMNRARNDRVKQIAFAVAHGVKSDPHDQINREVVAIVAQLEPQDIELLRAISNHNVPPDLREHTGDDAVDLANQASWSRLKRFDLLSFRQSTKEIKVEHSRGGPPETIDVPEVDRWGTPSGNHWISGLGISVLVSLGQSEPVQKTATLD